MGLQQYAQYQCLGHGAATGRLKLMLLYITVYHLIFHAVLLLNNVFLIKPILYIYVYIYIYIFIHIYMYIDIFIWYLKKSLCYIQSLYLTTSHYFLHYVSYVFKYFILLLCIITFDIDYCYMYVLLLHTPSHVWPEFNKLLSIVYWCQLISRHAAKSLLRYLI